MNLIAWITLGILAGVIAKAIYPNEENGGISVTAFFGAVGGFVGGSLVSYLKTGTIPLAATNVGIASLIFAALGAMIAIWFWGLMSRKRAI